MRRIPKNQLESGVIDKLEHFLLELGNGFTFVARQKRISFEDKHFWIDLFFYNRI
ncbi:MAG: PDDEXK nuclease domain-containing protein [Sphingobacterium sp.]